MRFLLVIILFLSTTFSSFGQNNDYMLWTKLGLKGKITKNLGYSGYVNTRIGGAGIETFFPQVGISYKLTKWLKPSIEYRFIIDKNKYSNYKSSNRINFNVEMEKDVSRFTGGLRIRYQYAFNSLVPKEYNPDFDQAFRFKPSVQYNIKGGKFSPFISSEFFYNPQLGLNGRQFSKVRFAVGSKVNLKGAHSVSFKYQFDKKFRNYKDGYRHIIALSYVYKL